MCSWYCPTFTEFFNVFFCPQCQFFDVTFLWPHLTIFLLLFCCFSRTDPDTAPGNFQCKFLSTPPCLGLEFLHHPHFLGPPVFVKFRSGSTDFHVHFWGLWWTFRHLPTIWACVYADALKCPYLAFCPVVVYFTTQPTKWGYMVKIWCWFLMVFTFSPGLAAIFSHGLRVYNIPF